MRNGGKIEQIKTIDLGFPIGLVEDITEFVAHLDIELHPGDGFVLYTDGITEAASPSDELYGLERLCQVISHSWNQSAHEIKQAVIADVQRHMGQQKILDDITLLVVKQK
jgi:serine phosphatase RsbU (regulator of sigma subunit)